MSKLLVWLERNPGINALLAFSFFLSVVVFHDEVTQLALKLRRAMSVEGYNLFFTLATVAGFGIWVGALWKKIIKTGDRRAVWLYLIPTLLLIAIFFAFMMTYSIEAVHFFQYAILAILLFPLVKSYGATVFWATILGMLDEIYQYVILTPNFNYFDFNDILLNLLGAGIAVVTIYLMTGIQFPARNKRRSYRSVFFTSLIIAATFGLLYLMNFISWHPATGTDAARWFPINRTPAPEHFWTQAYEGKFLHILRPWEGMFLTAGLMAYYFMLDRLPGKDLR